MDPNFWLMLEEFQHLDQWMDQRLARLGEQIEGHCSNLEKRVEDVDQRTEERFISLEMARAEADAERATMDKQFGDLCLEVNRLNCFIEREAMEHQQGKPGIFTSTDLDSVAETGEAHQVASSYKGLESSSAPTSGMFPRQPSPRVVDVSRVLNSVCPSGAVMESVRASQGRLTKLQFPVFNGDEPQLWHSRCENYFDMYGVEQHLWVRVALMHLEGPTTHWLQFVEHRLK
jgi:hypothetical protein